MDLYLFQQINQFAGRWYWLDTLGIFFAEYFEYLLIFCLFLFLLKGLKKYWPMIAQSLGAAVLARLGIVELIHLLWARPRPFVEYDVNLLIDKIDQPAFPSGHASFFFAIASIVYFYNKKAGILFFISAFLISLSRVFVGIHWPTDIIAGAAVGIFSGWLVSFLWKKLKIKFDKFT